MARAASDARLHAWLLAPALAVFTAFWLLPLTRLAVVGWSGPQVMGLVLGDYVTGSIWAIIGPALGIRVYKIFI